MSSTRLSWAEAIIADAKKGSEPFDRLPHYIARQVARLTPAQVRALEWIHKTNRTPADALSQTLRALADYGLITKARDGKGYYVTTAAWQVCEAVAQWVQLYGYIDRII